MKVAKRGGGVAFNVLTSLPSPDQLETVVSTVKKMAGEASELTPDELQKGLDEIGEYLKPAETKTENLPETIFKFREGFEKLLDESRVEQLIVLIDDLDRCLPKTAIETLEAIRLFLFVPRTAFVVGADEAMIEYAVRQHFPDLPVTSGPLPYARNYLEKLVQIPFRIPALGTQETRTYVALLLVQSIVGENHSGFDALLAQAKEDLKRPWLSAGLAQADIQEVDSDRRDELDSMFVVAQQIAPALAEGSKGNPRQIKRFLNALLIRQTIAKARGFGDVIKRPVLAKLMLAERFQPDFYEHIAAQAMASYEDGTARDLQLLESTGQTGKEPTTTTTSKGLANSKTVQQEDLSKWLERDWLKDWLYIEPMLAKEDLRPYVFVARDKRLLVGAADSEGLDALIQKLCGSRLAISAAEPEVRALTTGDAEAVFGALRERVLGAGDFKQQPAGIDGLAAVAKHHLHLQTEVVSLLGSLDPKSLGAWVVRGWNESITESQALGTFRELLRKWADHDDKVFLKQAASAALDTLAKGSR